MHPRILTVLAMGLALVCALGTWAALRAATVYASLTMLLPTAHALADERVDHLRPAMPTLARWAPSGGTAGRQAATAAAMGSAFDEDWRQVSRGLSLPPPLSLCPPLPLASTSGAETAAEALHAAASEATAAGWTEAAIRASLAGLTVAGAVIVAGDGSAGTSMGRARGAALISERAARDLLEALRVQRFAPSSLPLPLKRRVEEADRIFPIVARALARERLILPGAAAALLAARRPLPVEMDPALLSERVSALLPDPAIFRMPFATALASAAAGPSTPLERLRSRYRLRDGVPSLLGTLLIMGETLWDEATPVVNVTLLTLAPLQALTLYERETRARALLREAYVSVAITAARDERGVWPLTLDELPDGWQRDMTLDPWTGRPFDFRADDSSGISITAGFPSR